MADHNSVLHSRVESRCDHLLRQILPECDHAGLHLAVLLDEMLDDISLDVKQCRRGERQESSAHRKRYRHNCWILIDQPNGSLYWQT